MLVTQKVIPECRYGHGPLVWASHKGKMPEWGLVAKQDLQPGMAFLVAIYVCPTCGYSELFDLEPAQTVENERPK